MSHLASGFRRIRDTLIGNKDHAQPANVLAKEIREMIMLAGIDAGFTGNRVNITPDLLCRFSEIFSKMDNDITKQDQKNRQEEYLTICDGLMRNMPQPKDNETISIDVPENVIGTAATFLANSGKLSKWVNAYYYGDAARIKINPYTEVQATEVLNFTSGMNNDALRKYLSIKRTGVGEYDNYRVNILLFEV